MISAMLFSQPRSALLFWILRLSALSLCQNITVPAQCAAVASYADEVYESIGNNATVLCAQGGRFSVAYGRLTSCTSKYSTAVNVSTDALLGTAAQFCNNYNGTISSTNLVQVTTVISTVSPTDYNALLSSAASSAASIGSWLSSMCSIASVAGVPFSETNYCPTTGSTTSIIPPSAVASQQSTPTNTPKPSHVGVVVGATVGSVAFVTVIIVVLFFLLKRRRRNESVRKDRIAAQMSSEKPMLHSDDLQIPRKELPAGALLKIRTVGGLEELDATQSHDPSELPANEEVASGLRPDGTTLRGSNSHS